MPLPQKNKIEIATFSITYDRIWKRFISYHLFIKYICREFHTQSIPKIERGKELKHPPEIRKKINTSSICSPYNSHIFNKDSIRKLIFCLTVPLGVFIWRLGIFEGKWREASALYTTFPIRIYEEFLFQIFLKMEGKMGGRRRGRSTQLPCCRGRTRLDGQIQSWQGKAWCILMLTYHFRFSLKSGE